MAASRYADWLREAKDDLETARYLLEGGRYSKACFHAHQAAEKAVKALLIRRCGRYEEIHSVAGLLAIAREHIHVTEELMLKGNRLDRHYIPTRYPNAWPAGAPHQRYTKEDAEEAVVDAATLFEFVEEKTR